MYPRSDQEGRMQGTRQKQGKQRRGGTASHNHEAKLLRQRRHGARHSAGRIRHAGMECKARSFCGLQPTVGIIEVPHQFAGSNLPCGYCLNPPDKPRVRENAAGFPL